jgi:hypothetical protein
VFYVLHSVTKAILLTTIEAPFGTWDRISGGKGKNRGNEMSYLTNPIGI